MSKIIEDYMIMEEIGRGQYSVVMRGKHMVSKEMVAIKIYKIDVLDAHTEIRDIIDEEIHILKSIDSMNIIRCVKSFKTSSNIYVVYEYCETSLDRVIRSHLSIHDALVIFKDIVNGLRVLYERCILHRDLKPENILVKNSRYLIADLGFCKQLSSKNEQVTGGYGTPLYMSPEMVSNRRYGLNSDIYSIGVILYEMIYNEVPHAHTTNPDQLLSSILEEGPQFSKKKIPYKLEQLIRGLLEYNPALRMTHDRLFDMILHDNNYIHNIMTDDTGTNDRTADSSSMDSFMSEILYERYKYIYIIDVCNRSLQYSIHSSMNSMVILLLMKVSYTHLLKIKKILSIPYMIDTYNNYQYILSSPEYKSIEGTLHITHRYY